MKKSFVLFFIGLGLGFCTANYYFDADKIFNEGVKYGYEIHRQHVLFIANTNYQKGWEDCLSAKGTKKTIARR
jgi:hypothetical protein